MATNELLLLNPNRYVLERHDKLVTTIQVLMYLNCDLEILNYVVEGE